MTDSRFRRRLGVLWRDTGVHVVAQPPNPQARAVVLGGGSVMIWRVLDERLDVDELRALLSESPEGAPDRSDIEECLAEMFGLGVLSRFPGVPK